MRFDISEKTKWKLANKVTYNVFLRLLIFKFWFRVAFAAFVLLLVFLALFLPKIWRVSPQGMLPVVKVSGLDMVQAWALKRSAARELVAGHNDRAHYALLGAVNRNPGDADALRGLLSNLLAHPKVEPRSLENSLNYSFWLLHLTQTNGNDMELVSDVLGEYHYNDMVILLLSPIVDHLTPRQEGAYLKALFRDNMIPEFGRRWAKVKGERLPDNELPLYWAAYQAGWGPVETAAQGREKLAAALSDPAHRVLANRLQLPVCSKLRDVAGFETYLNRLEELQQDTPTDHAEYWRLLYLDGRREKAKQLAEAYSKPYTSSRDLISLTDACIGLGLRDLARRYFESAAQHLFGSEEVLVKYADFLAQDHKWDDMRAVAVQMRTQERGSQQFSGYSYFLEGWAERELGRTLPADQAFQKMNQNWMRGNGNLALVSGARLVQSQRAADARELMLKFEDELKPRVEYWELLFQAATQLKDADLLVKAARHEYELLPDDPDAANHYAGALLIRREDPDLAVKLTMQLMAAYPASAAARINHAFALLLNHRATEARNTLAPLKLKLNLLTREEATSFYMAAFQIACDLRRYEDAWQMLDRIDTKYLFPTDLAWIEESRKKLPPRAQAKL
jgi:hypothetical protein